MNVDMFYVAVIVLMGVAVFDLMVGVSNDAVNFLNSSVGSKVAPRYVIMIVASLGILAGVTFSSGMMEVARKGIFHPQFFSMPELMTIFLAVMLADIILLDLFNTFGFPTSTTVSIVFELLGAAVAASVIKVVQTDGSWTAIADYINSSKAMTIILGILLSVMVAFVFGAIAQFLSRLLFTFDYVKRMKRYGAVWGGAALTCITFFILIKGAKGSSFMTSDTVAWIKSNAGYILLAIFIVSSVFLQVMIQLRTNILRLIILVGTFALAMAFAANDLVNFIGVPLAGLMAYKTAALSSDPLGVLMGALSQKTQTETWLLLIAGMVMVVTLWLSKKARTVTDTEVKLGQQGEGPEKFQSTAISRMVVRMVSAFFGSVKVLVPMAIRDAVDRRVNPEHYESMISDERGTSFDLIRASVNLMVASVVVSFATSLKLPLSTTYVTFMVAMGTSFSDRAWGRESAVYRVTGVIMVIGGWFVTALMAFSIAFVFANIINLSFAYGTLALLVVAAFSFWRSNIAHKEKTKVNVEEEVFNIRKAKDPVKTIATTFDHMALLVGEIRADLDMALTALFDEQLDPLKKAKKKAKRIQKWTNIIVANIFKALRLLQKEEVDISYKYAQTIRRLQKFSDGYRDIVTRAYRHVANHHKGLLPIQIDELSRVKTAVLDILHELEFSFSQKRTNGLQVVVDKDRKLRELANSLNPKQIERIKSNDSKTRLSILYYSIMGDALMLSKQSRKLLEVFQHSFGHEKILEHLDDME